jgi:hypothetical protein
MAGTAPFGATLAATKPCSEAAENPTAFITDLTFESAGNFTGTMTPITVSVPEPSVWAMMLFGFAGLGLAGYRASRKTLAIAA